MREVVNTGADFVHAVTVVGSQKGLTFDLAGVAVSSDLNELGEDVNLVSISAGIEGGEGSHVTHLHGGVKDAMTRAIVTIFFR